MWISGCWWGRDASSDENLVGTKHALLKCRSVRRKPPGEQWSRRETDEARGTKWNFDVEMDSGVSGPPVTSRPDEGMPTATTREEIPTVPPPAPPPEEHVPEMRGQGVHAKALRIRAFWSEIGRTPGCPACETPSPGKSHTLVNARRIKMSGTRAAEQHQRRRRNVELLEIQIHDRWTRVEVRRIPSRRGQKQPLWQVTRTWRTRRMRITSEEDQRHIINWNQSTMFPSCTVSWMLLVTLHVVAEVVGGGSYRPLCR